MLIDTLENQYKRAIDKKYDILYFAIDVHDTIVHGNYNADILPTDFLVGAKETLQMLSKRTDVCLIMYTCSHKSEILKYLEYFKEHDINFKHVNNNPEVPDSALGSYIDKMYFNILLDDKAGFIESDWKTIYDFFIDKPILK